MPPTKPRTISPEKAKCCAESRTTIADLIDEWGKENFHDDWYCGSDVEKTLSVFHLGSLGYFIGKKLKEQQQDLLRARESVLVEARVKMMELVEECPGCKAANRICYLHLASANIIEGALSEIRRLLGEKGERK